MTRIDRRGFESAVRWWKCALDNPDTMTVAGETVGFTKEWAALHALLKTFCVHEKCRVVVVYDPAEKKVAVYREELNGTVKKFSEVPAQTQGAI